jgi:hypothetical protein
MAFVVAAGVGCETTVDIGDLRTVAGQPVNRTVRLTRFAVYKPQTGPRNSGWAKVETRPNSTQDKKKRLLKKASGFL